MDGIKVQVRPLKVRHLSVYVECEVSASMHPPRGHQIGNNVRSRSANFLFAYVTERLLLIYTRAELRIETNRILNSRLNVTCSAKWQLMIPGSPCLFNKQFVRS